MIDEAIGVLANDPAFMVTSDRDDPYGTARWQLERISVVTDADLAHFRTFGFVALRGVFDPGPLSEEVDRSLRDGFRSSVETRVGAGGIEFRYVPTMCERTPVSLSLLDRFARSAAELLGASILPGRAKGTLYSGATDWHTDSDQDVASVGFACYLEPLRAGKGALQVLPGSHRPEFANALKEYGTDHRLDLAVTLPGYAVETDSGDVIAFDEHLYHASSGGQNRRQWRVDYVADPVGVEEEAKVRAYFAGQHPPGWDGGYDIDRYPSYGAHWLASGRPWIERLGQLGVYDAAAAEEDFARSRRG